MNEQSAAIAERPRVGTVFASTLGHDLMALTLEMLRTMPDHWLRMSEEQQQKAIERVRARIAEAVTDTAQIVMRAQYPAVPAELDSITIKDGVKITLSMAANAPGRHEVYDAKGKHVLIVLAESERWLERMDEIKAHADQLQLFNDDYDPSVDQPGYRRDQPASAPGFMTWADLKSKLAGGEITQQQAEEAFGGPLPAEEPKAEAVTLAVEYPIQTVIEILQGDGTWVEARVEKLRRGLVYRIGADVFTLTTDPQPVADDGPVLLMRFQVEPSQPLKFGSADKHAAASVQGESTVASARTDIESSAALSALHERLYALRITISLGALKALTPEQFVVTDQWSAAYAADPKGCKIARPLWLPIPDADNSTNEEG